VKKKKNGRRRCNQSRDKQIGGKTRRIVEMEYLRGRGKVSSRVPGQGEEEPNAGMQKKTQLKGGGSKENTGRRYASSNQSHGMWTFVLRRGQELNRRGNLHCGKGPRAWMEK